MSKVGWCGDTSGGPWGPMEPPDTGCQTCGDEPEWIECWQCFGYGDFDLYEEDPILYAPGQTAACDECNGEGGWLICRNCERNAPQHSEKP